MTGLDLKPADCSSIQATNRRGFQTEFGAPDFSRSRYPIACPSGAQWQGHEWLDVTAINYVSLTARKRCRRWLEGDVLGPEQDLPDGPLKFQVMVTDPACNESPSSFLQWCRAFLLNSMETVFYEGAKNSSEPGRAMIGLPQKSLRCGPGQVPTISRSATPPSVRLRGRPKPSRYSALGDNPNK